VVICGGHFGVDHETNERFLGSCIYGWVGSCADPAGHSAISCRGKLRAKELEGDNRLYVSRLCERRDPRHSSRRCSNIRYVPIFLVHTSPTNPSDFALCAISIAIAAVFHPLLILFRLWPYIALLVSFGAFVSWNGGVVLGTSSSSIVPNLQLPPRIVY
jgi:hypothetical protein